MQDLFDDEISDREICITVEQDECTKAASEAFDVAFSGKTTFLKWAKPIIDSDYSLGALVGPSGTGKTLLLKDFGQIKTIEWNRNKAIVSQFANKETAFNRLTGVGLNTIPSWLKPYHVLSNGEQYRAYLARALANNVVIDEFTSVVDRMVAKAMCVGVKRLIRNENLKGIVIATCHYDILEWLEPDWWFDTASGTLARGGLRRPKIEIAIHRTNAEMWSLFASHHYLSTALNSAAECYVAAWNGEPIGFCAILPLPHAQIKNAWRGHRTVILPDYQGLGIGVRLSDAIAEIMLDKGRRYFSKTMHPRMGDYRNRSPLWKATSVNGKIRMRSYVNNTKLTSLNNSVRFDKIAYSHEYIGSDQNRYVQLEKKSETLSFDF